MQLKTGFILIEYEMISGSQLMRQTEKKGVPPIPADLDSALTEFKKVVKLKGNKVKRKRFLQPIIRLFRPFGL